MSPKIPTPTELSALNMWPSGTIGEKQDSEMIKSLLELCIKHGFGRVAQVASDIEHIWNHPESLKSYAERKEAFLKSLTEYKKD